MNRYLAERRKELGLTQLEVAEAVEVSEATVSRWESGGIANMRRDKIAAYAKVLQTSTNFIMTGEKEEQKSAPVPPGLLPIPEMEKIPLIGKIACGTPITAEENVVGKVDAPKDRHADFALLCEGDSMKDFGIQNGDVVYIRKQPQVENGEIAAVRIDGMEAEATLKRVYFDGKILQLIPANPQYQPMIYSGEDLLNIHIEGKAVGYAHWF